MEEDDGNNLNNFDDKAIVNICGKDDRKTRHIDRELRVSN